MHILIIIDDAVDLSRFDKKFRAADLIVTLFPLTSNFITLEKVRQQLLTYSNLTIDVVDSAALINAAVNDMRDTIHTWSYQLGETQLGQKKLKDWFIFPDQGGSSWWLSLLAEKNSVQDSAFFKIAQINAIEKYLQEHAFDACALGLADKRQTRSLRKMLSPNVKFFTYLRRHATVKKSFKQSLLDYVNHSGLMGALFASMMYWIIWLKDSRAARKTLPPLTTRLKPDHSLLFITYFPNIDEEQAKVGIFRNKYALPLQDKLAELNRPVTWLTMPVYYNGHHFQSAMRLATQCCAQGESLLVLQEFFTFAVFCRALGWWIRQAVISFRLLWRLRKTQMIGQLTHPAAYSLIKYLWWHSFIGASGTRGILFYLTYQQAFQAIPKMSACLYYCEMQAWEKAMLMAKKKQQPAMQTIAFQHTVVMENFFNYFYHPDAVLAAQTAADFPHPDQLLANGTAMHALLSKTPWPHLGQAEAIRHLYISQLQTHALPERSKKVLLIVGSYDRIETTSLITLAHAAFPMANDFEIWIKGSPVNPVEPLLKQLGIEADKSRYKICYQSVADLLPSTTIALVANTTVAIEALALGCELIIPLFADTMMMNPAVTADMEYTLVSHPQQLQTCVASLLQKNHRMSAATSKAFIHHYWHLDPAIPRWTDILKSIPCPQPQ